MNIRIAIVDDQAQTRELLRQDLLVRVPDGASIACFDGGEAFLSGFTPRLRSGCASGARAA